MAVWSKKPRLPVPKPSVRPKPHKVSQATIFHKEHGKYMWDLEEQAMGEESRSCNDFLSACQVILYNSLPQLKGALATSYHLLLGQTPSVTSTHPATEDFSHGRTASCSCFPITSAQMISQAQKATPFCQILWRACLWVEPLQRLLWEDPPSPKRWETPAWFKTLKPSHAKAFSWDSKMVKEARREFFSKHFYDFYHWQCPWSLQNI